MANTDRKFAYYILQDCHIGWVKFDGHCYLLPIAKLSWYGANSYCQNHLSSHLVSVKTTEEMDHIHEWLDQGGLVGDEVFIWTSVKKMDDGFVWGDDNSQVSDEMWISGGCLKEISKDSRDI